MGDGGGQPPPPILPHCARHPLRNLPAPAMTTLSGLAGRGKDASEAESAAASWKGADVSMLGRG